MKISKLFFILIIFIFSFTYIIADEVDEDTSVSESEIEVETENIVSEEITEKDTTNNKNKEKPFSIGGYLEFILAYYLNSNPREIDNNISLINNEYYHDYTDSGDKYNDYHTTDDKGSIIKPSFLKLEGMITAKLILKHDFFQFDHFLFSGNNIKSTFTFQITPVSINAGTELIITPIAFMELRAGLRFGSGWNIPNLAVGLARNNHSGNDPDIAQIMHEDTDSFYGPVLETWFKGVIQFDTAFIFPEEKRRWTHIIFQFTPGLRSITLLNYPHYDRPFMWEFTNELNGWKYTFNGIIGYKIPIIEDKTEHKEAPFPLEVSQHVKNVDLSLLFWMELKGHITHALDSPMASGGWGSDFAEYRFGPTIKLDIPRNISFLLAAHWINAMEYSDATIGNSDFMNKEYVDWYVKFYRVVMSVSWSF